jgi:hypothetical protein
MLTLIEHLAESKVWIGLCGFGIIGLPIIGIVLIHSKYDAK